MFDIVCLQVLLYSNLPGYLHSLSIWLAMGHNSASANCLQVSFNIWCVSGKSIKAAPEKLDDNTLEWLFASAKGWHLECFKMPFLCTKFDCAVKEVLPKFSVEKSLRITKNGMPFGICCIKKMNGLWTFMLFNLLKTTHTHNLAHEGQ